MSYLSKIPDDIISTLEAFRNIRITKVYMVSLMTNITQIVTSISIFPWLEGMYV